MADKLQLYVKAGRDGESLGDCPFCHSVHMLSVHKGVEVELVLIDLADKPADFLAMCERAGAKGSVPVLRRGDEVVPGSGAIASYLQKHFPEPNMDCASADRVAVVTGRLFPAFAALMKSKDESERGKLSLALESELNGINVWLATEPGRFLCGDVITIPDCLLAPKLQHIAVAGKHYRDFSIPAQMTALHCYTDAMFKSQEFSSTNGGDSEVLHGWSKFF